MGAVLLTTTTATLLLLPSWGGTMAAWSSPTIVGLALVVTGAGLGLVMPNLTVAIQNAVPPEMLGVATSAVSFFRSLGGAFGVALSGSLLTGRVDASLAAAGSAAAAARRATYPPLLHHSTGHDLAALPPELHELVAAAYRQAIGTTFAIGAVITGFGSHPLRGL